jgi:hypothetical protein
MFEKRKSIRYPTIARAVIKDLNETEALLKDLSVTGCCVEYTMFVDAKQHNNYKVVIYPDSASGIDAFELEAECRWIRDAGYSCEIGFAITASPKGKTFQRYVDYLAYRSQHAS